jgi:hypothetical protein
VTPTRTCRNYAISNLKVAAYNADTRLRYYAITADTQHNHYPIIRMPVYLIRLAQTHESFRKVELQALADIAGINIEFVNYEEDVGRYFHHLSSIVTEHTFSHRRAQSYHIPSLSNIGSLHTAL